MLDTAFSNLFPKNKRLFLMKINGLQRALSAFKFHLFTFAFLLLPFAFCLLLATYLLLPPF
jgi:hypothetical protein